MKKETLIENNINLHELITNELLNNHSIAVFIMLLEMGREIEFYYQEELFSITRLDNRYILSGGKSVQSFENALDTVTRGTIASQYIINCWFAIKIKALF